MGKRDRIALIIFFALPPLALEVDALLWTILAISHPVGHFAIINQHI
jgi:hypothetical protein